MGASGSKDNKGLDKSEINEISKKTHFTSKELKGIYKEFIDDHPSGEIDRKGLAQLTGLLGMEDSFLIDRLFKVYDLNGDGTIDFHEVAVVLSIMMKGSFEEKLKFVFTVYDIDGDGFISREEVSKIVSSLLVTASGEAKLPTGTTSTDDAVDKFFALADHNKDGKISQEEFTVTAQQNPHFMNALAGFFS